MKHETLKFMGIMQDNLRHPYILSTTVLSDRKFIVSFLSRMEDMPYTAAKVCVVMQNHTLLIAYHLFSLGYS